MGSACTKSEAAESECSSFSSEILFCLDGGGDQHSHKPSWAVKWKLVGTGTFGKIMKCTDNEGVDFALKISKLAEIRRELACAKLLGKEATNNNLMTYHDSNCNLECGCATITYDYQVGAPLLTSLLHMSYTECEVRNIIKQCIVALAYMHDNDLIHMDVKPDNIVVNPETGHTCLVDYSTATLRTTVPRDGKGYTMYSPPELVSMREDAAVPCTPSVDVWGIGAVAYHCLAGYPPFTSPRSIIKVWYPTPPSLITTISQHSQSFVSSCLEDNPQSRLEAAAALKHSWFMNPAPLAPLCLARYNLQFPYDI